MYLNKSLKSFNSFGVESSAAIHVRIENIEQLELLKLSGCTIGQGFLFSKAVSHQQATLMLGKTV